jgi:hypothetical protein
MAIASTKIGSLAKSVEMQTSGTLLVQYVDMVLSSARAIDKKTYLTLQEVKSCTTIHTLLRY